MTESEKISGVYVEIRASDDKFKSDMDKLRSKLDKDAKKMEEKLNFKAKFDTSVANFRISELQKLRQKLQKEFEKKISIDVSSTSLDRTREKIAAVDARLRGVGESAAISGKSMMNAFAWVGGIAGTFAILKNMITAARESAVVHAQIYKAVETTGKAAGYTAKELFKLADELKGLTAIDDDTILKDITNNLLTFKNVSGDAFKRAQLAILDLNAVISKGEVGALTSQTIQLGKALNAPTEGVTALTRVGVSFTEQQKEQIKTLEQSGNLLEAQSIILREIEQQYGGQAKVLAEMDGGYKKFNQTIDDISETIGNDLVGSANEGTGALQELATGFLELNDAVKEVNSGVGIFGAIISGLKNIVTGGKGIMDTAFNIKGQYKEAKEKYIKDIQDAKQKTEAFYDAIGYGKKDTSPKIFSPILDTTAGDEVLKQYDEQQTKIDQIKNKLKDVNLTTEQRLTLEKELNSFKDKGGNKSNNLEGNNYIEKLVNYLDEYRNKIKMLNDELSKLGEGDSEKKLILTVELSKLKEQLSQEELKLNIKAGNVDSDFSDIKPKGLKVDDGIATKLKENLNLRLQAHQEYLDAVGLLNEEAFNVAKAKIDKEYEMFVAAGVAQEEAQAIHDAKMKELRDARQSEEDAILDAQLKNIAVLADSLDGFAATAKQLGGEQSAAYKLFAITQATIATYLAASKALAEVPFPFNFIAAGSVVAAGLANVSQIASAHSGGEFIGTSNGVKKMSGGGSFIVPPGFPHDSYPLLVESGERVSVTPSGKSGQSGLSGVDVDRIVNAIRAMNMNLIDKDFSATIINNSPDVTTTVRRGEKVKNQLTRQGAKLNER